MIPDDDEMQTTPLGIKLVGDVFIGLECSDFSTWDFRECSSLTKVPPVPYFEMIGISQAPITFARGIRNSFRPSYGVHWCLPVLTLHSPRADCPLTFRDHRLGDAERFQQAVGWHWLKMRRQTADHFCEQTQDRRAHSEEPR